MLTTTSELGSERKIRIVQSADVDDVHRVGFTLVELLVTMGIIVVLLAIAVLAGKAIIGGAKGSANQVVMGQLRATLDEAERAGLIRRAVGVASINWPGDGSKYSPAQVFVSVGSKGASGRAYDFWRAPDADIVDPNRLGGVTLFSPGIVSEDAKVVQEDQNPQLDLWAKGVPMWYGSDLAVNTAIATAMLRNVQTAGRIFDSLPSQANQVPVFHDPGKSYQKGAVVLYSIPSGRFAGPHVFRAIQTVPAGALPPLSGDDANWERWFGGVLDNSKHLIFFVPASGMHIGKFVLSGSAFDSTKSDLNRVPGDRVYITPDNKADNPSRVYFECIAPTKFPPDVPTNDPNWKLPPGSPWRIADPIRDPAGKPFWASAGPDGDLDTPADNQYSFQQ